MVSVGVGGVTVVRGADTSAEGGVIGRISEARTGIVVDFLLGRFAGSSSSGSLWLSPVSGRATVLLRPSGLLTPLPVSPFARSGLVLGLLLDLLKTFLNFEAGDFPLSLLFVLADLESGRNDSALSKRPTFGDGGSGSVTGGLLGEGEDSSFGGSTRTGTLCECTSPLVSAAVSVCSGNLEVLIKGEVVVKYGAWDSREVNGGGLFGGVSASESSVRRLFSPKLLAFRLNGSGGVDKFVVAGRPLDNSSSAALSSSSLIFRLCLLLCPGTYFLIPLLPDLLLLRLGLECVLCLVGDLSRLRESIESVARLMLLSLASSVDRRRLEKIFFNPLF